MSHDVDIFVAGPGDLADLARRVAEALELALERLDGNGTVLYQSLDPQRDVVLLEHELADDGELRFSRFPYQLSVRTIGVDGDGDDKEEADRQLGHWVLARLAGAGLGPAMLVEGLQRQLAQMP